jgi:hypothetical protein
MPVAADRPSPPEPVLPDYGGACLDGVVPALLAPAGDRPDWLPPPAATAAQVVLLVLDGLGWHQLRDRHHLAPTMAAMAGGPITSVCPTTTATALTSIATGRPPAAHGVVGYRVRVDGPTGDEVLNVLRWRTVSGDAREFVVPATFASGAPFAGRPVPVVSRAEFSGTGFSAAHLGGSRPVPYHLASSIAVEVRSLLAAGEPLVYAYWDGVDKIAHIAGLGDHYDAEVTAVDALVGAVAGALPAGAALVITADHGQVEVGAGARPLAGSLVDTAALVSGEARFRWLHAQPGQGQRLVEEARAAYGEEAWVVTAEQAIDEGWFGGPLAGDVRRRLGDVAVVPHQPVGYLDPADSGDARLVCRHGSLTADEMLVPLLAVGG